MLVPVLRPLSLGEVLDTSFGIYRRLFAPLLVISAATQAIPLAIGVFVEAAGGMVQQPAMAMLGYGLAIVFGAVGTAASTFLVAETYLGGSLTTQEAVLRSTPYLGRLIASSVLVSLVAGLGLVLLIVPGLILLSGLFITPAALVLEDIAAPTTAMARSWELSRGYRGKVFGALSAILLLLIIPGLAIGAFTVGTSDASATEATLSAGAMAVQSALQILVYPLIYVLTTVLYYDLRVRKEGFDLEMLASSLQQE
ncbi:MAG: hypothetical protein ACLGIK_14130 [Gemmatimonadota bacterium]